MTRQQILAQVEEDFGSVPDYFRDMPDQVLEQHWTALQWFNSDTGLPARDKSLVALGAASAIHCHY